MSDLHRFATHYFSRSQGGPDDVLVAGAATKASGQAWPNFLLGRIRVAAQKVDQGHQETWCTEAALQRMMGAKSLLQRVERFILHQPLNRGNLRPSRLNCEHQAATHRLPVH